MSQANPASSTKNRRLFLRDALGIGGLLLPWAGSKALALTNPSAAEVPVSVKPMPVSAEGAELRRLRAAMMDYYTNGGRTMSETQLHEWRSMFRPYTKTAFALAEKPPASWSHCVELAEAAWHMMPKEEVMVGRVSEYTGRLSVRADGGSVAYQQLKEPDVRLQVFAALVEAVLTLGDGERKDPNMVGCRLTPLTLHSHHYRE